MEELLKLSKLYDVALNAYERDVSKISRFFHRERDSSLWVPKNIKFWLGSSTSTTYYPRREPFLTKFLNPVLFKYEVIKIPSYLGEAELYWMQEDDKRIPKTHKIEDLKKKFEGNFVFFLIKGHFPNAVAWDVTD